MIDAAIIPLKEHFSSLDDPRAQHSIEHLLLDIVLITICAVICGADTWVEIENYGNGIAQLDEQIYETGIEILEDEFAAISIERDKFHGEWNYRIKPRTLNGSVD